MELIKERNFVIASECGVVLGKWDILTGNFYGKSGATVRSKPRCFTFDNIRAATCETMLNILYREFYDKSLSLLYYRTCKGIGRVYVRWTLPKYNFSPY